MLKLIFICTASTELMELDLDLSDTQLSVSDALHSTAEILYGQENTLHVQNEQNRSSYQQITSSCGSCVILNQRVDVLQQNIHWLWIQHQLLQITLMSIKSVKEKMCFDFPHTFLKNCSKSFVGGEF